MLRVQQYGLRKCTEYVHEPSVQSVKCVNELSKMEVTSVKPMCCVWIHWSYFDDIWYWSLYVKSSWVNLILIISVEYIVYFTWNSNQTLWISFQKELIIQKLCITFIMFFLISNFYFKYFLIWWIFNWETSEGTIYHCVAALVGAYCQVFLLYLSWFTLIFLD